MHPRHTHTAAELVPLATDSLIFSGWLDLGGYLVPVLLRRHRSHTERRRRVLRLNGRTSPR